MPALSLWLVLNFCAAVDLTQLKKKKKNSPSRALSMKLEHSAFPSVCFFRQKKKMNRAAYGAVTAVRRGKKKQQQQQQKETLLNSSVRNGVSLFSRQQSSFFWLHKIGRGVRLLKGGKKPRAPRLLFFSSHFNKCQPDMRGRETFWGETMYSRRPHTDARRLCRTQRRIYSLGEMFQSKIAACAHARACVSASWFQTRWDGVVWHWCILTEIDCSIFVRCTRAPADIVDKVK